MNDIYRHFQQQTVQPFSRQTWNEREMTKYSLILLFKTNLLSTIGLLDIAIIIKVSLLTFLCCPGN